ncbi:MAG TPA: RDD family protein [Gammaproteobacteria bacterium]|nr:RDD family protein [Gammaproteobacteria bacterium]
MTRPSPEAGSPRRATPGLGRRLAACLYDALVLAAVLMLAATLWVAVTQAAAAPGDWLFRAYVLAVSAVFFAALWTRGETLGMRAWKLRVEGPDGRPPGWRAALLRFFFALFSWAALGLGYLWVLVDRDGLAWHDRLSNTRLVLRNASAGARHAEKRRGKDEAHG